jgi:peptidoglycan hydrolase CwlO-like protein
MTLEKLQVQLEKIESDLRKNEEKRKELLGKKTEIDLQIAQLEAEKAEKVLAIIKDNFGEINEQNVELFQKVMESQSEQILRQKELMEKQAGPEFR